MENTIKIYEQIQQQFQPNEIFNTVELSTKLQLSRSMASNYLNQLVRLAYLKKENTRPVKYWYEVVGDAFSDLIGGEDSMKTIIKQCKVAVNYPPDGIPLIIRGSSGVGKSMIASRIHKYAQSEGVIRADAPFVTLNCADYANNPELLSSILFGYVKGAFTGAEKEKPGLLAAANNGYLFLDEVHNLSQENQEKLFLLIDQKKYRRLGEDHQWCHANVRLILATTENVETKLLKTFRRRIPLEITLPDFIQRSRQERVALVQHFFQEEATKIDKELWIDPRLIQQIVQLDLDGNVGAIQNRIKIYCATAYSENKTAPSLRIPSEPAKAVGELLCITPQKISQPQQQINQEIYLTLQANLAPISTFQEVIELIPNILELKQALTKPSAAVIDEYALILATLKNKPLAHNPFGLIFTEKEIEAISFLLYVRSFLTYDYELSLEPTLIKYQEIATFLLSEAEVSTTDRLAEYLLLAYLVQAKPLKSQRNALIVMHGNSMASNMALEINHLVNDYVFDAIDMPMQVDTKKIVEQVNQYVLNRDTRDGLLLLVDMGSLERMYEEIKNNVAGDLLIVNNVSTALALHIGFSLMQNHAMDYYTSLDYSQFNIQPQYFEGLSQLENIVISCMSGEGIAQKIKDIFMAETPLKPLEIITLDFEKLLELEKSKNINAFKNTFAVISTASVKLPKVTCLNLEKIINGTDSLARLTQLYDSEQLAHITNELIKLFTIEGAGSRLKFLNPTLVINEIEEIITALEACFELRLESFIRVNLFLHLSSMIERILIGDYVKEEANEGRSDAVQEFMTVTEKLFEPIKEKYHIAIPAKEYEYIYMILQANA